MLNGQKERVKNDQASIIYIVLVSEKKNETKLISILLMTSLYTRNLYKF